MELEKEVDAGDPGAEDGVGAGAEVEAQVLKAEGQPDQGGVQPSDLEVDPILRPLDQLVRLESEWQASAARSEDAWEDPLGVGCAVD